MPGFGICSDQRRFQNPGEAAGTHPTYVPRGPSTRDRDRGRTLVPGPRHTAATAIGSPLTLRFTACCRVYPAGMIDVHRRQDQHLTAREARAHDVASRLLGMKRIPLLIVAVLAGMVAINAALDRVNDCDCLDDCWCKTRLGHHARWWVPVRYHHSLRPSSAQTRSAGTGMPPASISARASRAAWASVKSSSSS